ncbi:MAG: tetratricopeptide repeat protein [Verrucomicrobiota bacterium]
MESPLILRAHLLLERQRYADAEKLLRENLALDPEDPASMRLLGICQFGRDALADSLNTFDRALSLSPEEADLHVWRARVLTRQHKFSSAHEALDAAQALDPDLAEIASTRALVFYNDTKWSEAEAAARAAMELDADDTNAQNILSHSLLMQGRQHESEAHIHSRLQRDPENDLTHVAAGYAALRRGDHRGAAVHFAEALRLDPENESAREGLLTSFRARSLVYRSFLAFSFQVAKLQMKYRQWLFLGAWVVYKVVVSALQPISPGLAMLVMVLYGLFVFWSYVAQGIGTLFILGDRQARLALRFPEKAEGLIVGGGAVLGLALVLLTFVPLPLPPTLALGLGLMLMTIPWSLSLGNPNAMGRKIYGALAFVASVGVLLVLAGMFVPSASRLTGTGLSCASMSTMLATILALFNFKRRPD